jgi:hypothetical protein
VQARAHVTPYPPWALFIAGLLVLSTMLPVPFVFFMRFFRIWKFDADLVTVGKEKIGPPALALTTSKPANVGEEK